jgi:hypothetical protein
LDHQQLGRAAVDGTWTESSVSCKAQWWIRRSAGCSYWTAICMIVAKAILWSSLTLEILLIIVFKLLDLWPAYSPLASPFLGDSMWQSWHNWHSIPQILL